MIVFSLLLILVAVALLALGLTTGSSSLLIASIVASLVAAIVLVIGARRSAALRRANEEDPTLVEPRRAAETRPVAEPSRGDEPSRSAGGRPFVAAGGVPRSGEADFARSVDEPDAGEVSPDGRAEATAYAGSPDYADHSDDTGEIYGDAAMDGPEVVPGDEPSRGGGQPGPGRGRAGFDSDDPGFSDESGPAGDLGPAGDSAAGGDLGPADPDDPADEPRPQIVRPADAARVARLQSEVLVVDGRPRYHLADCPSLADRSTEPLPAAEAVELGFTPCGLCRPVDRLVAAAAHS